MWLCRGLTRPGVGAWSDTWGRAARVLQGDHLVGKYCCLLCPKEFGSESGVKYHILKAHAEVGGWGL